MKSLLPSLLNFILFQVGWFGCVLSAAQGYFWLGPGIVAGVLALHFAFARAGRREALLLLAMGILGTLIDSIQAAAGVFSFSAGWSAPAWLCPPWLVAMWPNFGILLRHSISWLRDRPLLAAVLGGLGGPASYYAGAQMGAISLAENTALSLAVLAVVWASVTPGLFRLSKWLDETRNQPEIPAE